jgi:4'-phosphopantetheinyl transferase
LGFSHKKALLKEINAEQKEKALAFKNENDQMRSLLSSYLKNQLSNESLNKNEMGKPFYLNGPHFNISHSGKYVVMAVADNNVGVDIEEIIEKNFDMLLRLFNEAEVKMIKEHADFYYLWCAKESLIKCMGKSINKIKEVPSLPLNGLKTFKGQDYMSQTFIYDKHIISITRESNEEFNVNIKLLKRLPKQL